MIDNLTIDCSAAGVVGKLYQELGPFAVSKTQYLVGDLSTAQDIVHDVFEKLCRKPMNFPNRDDAYRWIYRCCHNAGIDFLRTRKRRAESLVNVKDILFPEPKTPQDRLANRQTLCMFIGHLDQRQSQIMGYLAIDGLSHKEAAVLLGISEKTVQRSIADISKKLLHIRRSFHEPR
ncbi:MAG: RNA polymerase sigma factor [Proteobacteria bacterium]|nr:RNA polymerase sigma factor [Pseudomonadota bacterium]